MRVGSPYRLRVRKTDRAWRQQHALWLQRSRRAARCMRVELGEVRLRKLLDGGDDGDNSNNNDNDNNNSNTGGGGGGKRSAYDDLVSLKAVRLPAELSAAIAPLPAIYPHQRIIRCP